jgi:hypothetical protein
VAGRGAVVNEQSQRLCDALQSCEERTFGGGPGPQNENGTMGRFRYFPDFGVFAVVNDIDRDAYTLRLTP